MPRKKSPPPRETAERDEIVGALLYAEHCPTIEDLVVRLHRQLDLTTSALEATSQALLSLRQTVTEVQQDRDRARDRAAQIEAQRAAESQRLALEAVRLADEVARAREAAEASDTKARAARQAADSACKLAAEARKTAQDTRDILGAREIPTGKKPKVSPDDAWAWLRLERSVRPELGPLTRDHLADPRAADLLSVVYRAQRAPMGLERADAIRDLRAALQITRARLETP